MSRAKSKERRRFRRFRSFNIIKLIDPKTGQPFESNSTLVNISEGGLCFYSSELMKRKERVLLKIDIQEFNSQVETYGKVAWCQKSTEHVGSYFTGIEFIDIRENEKDIIRRLDEAAKKL